MKPIRLAIQIVFYALVLGLLVSHSVSAGFSHDENQFVSPGQLLADRGLLPYVDYPYTHVPYAILFYALSAKLSSYDFLAARIMNAVAWFSCILLMAAIFRLHSHLFSSGQVTSQPAPATQLFSEFVLVFVLLNHPLATYVLGAALNHSFATLFSLLGLFLFLRCLRDYSQTLCAGSGACIGLAALIRLNYASLAGILLILWLAFACAGRRIAAQTPSSAAAESKVREFTKVLPFLAGLLLAGLPALGLFARAPYQSYYGNLVYIRLNTAYYQELSYDINMTLQSKLNSFLAGVFHRPIDMVLYGGLILLSCLLLLGFARRKTTLPDLGKVAVAGFAVTMLVTAFAPTPSLSHYLFAPLPFLLISLAWLGLDLLRKNQWAHFISLALVLLVLVATVKIGNPVNQLALLSDPARWTPVQVHDFDEQVKAEVVRGRVLSLLPMMPSEAGLEVYPFAATGPFSWRTSLLLTPQRRAQYAVTSPDELPAVLDRLPPDGILSGFEAPNAGFSPDDLGGLEKPFVEYATKHGYKPVSLTPPFLEHAIILWVKPP